MKDMEFKRKPSGFLAVIVVILVGLFVAGLSWRFVEYYRVKRSPAVSLYNEWSVHGFPVDVCKLKRGKFKIWRRTTATLASDGTLHAFVTKHMKNELRTGQQVFVDLKDASMPARVFSVSNVRDIDTGLYVIRFRPNDASALPGAPFYHVRVNAMTIPDALAVPLEAIQGDGDDRFVWVLDDTRVKRMPVKTGISDGVKTLLSNGVESAASIVTAGFKNLVDGLNVYIHTTSTCADFEE